MKNFLIAGLVMLAATAAQASYLYWQVNASDLTQAISDYNTKWNPSTTLTQDNITAARIVQVSANGEEIKGALQKADFGGKSQYFELPADAATGGSYSYYIEIISNASGLPSQVALSETKTYTEIVTENPNVVFTGNEMDIPQISLNAWTGGAYTAAPEPTTGLLVLIGVGLLGLKRKRA